MKPNSVNKRAYVGARYWRCLCPADCLRVRPGLAQGIFFAYRLALTAPTERFNNLATSLSGLTPSSRSSFLVQTRSPGLTGFPRRAAKCLAMLLNQCVGFGRRNAASSRAFPPGVSLCGLPILILDRWARSAGVNASL